MNNLEMLFKRLEALEELALVTARHLDSTGMPSRVGLENMYDEFSRPDVETALSDYQSRRNFLEAEQLDKVEEIIINKLDEQNSKYPYERNNKTKLKLALQSDYTEALKKIEKLTNSLKRVRMENRKLKKKDK